MGRLATVAATGICVAGAVGLLNGLTPRFGGEDPLGQAPDADNWHHEGITLRAARRAGWSEAAARSLALHAHRLDSYAYDPLWWLDPAQGGGEQRLAAVVATQHELVKLHFDDLVTGDQVRATWTRYLSGTVAGLLWAAGELADHPRLWTATAHHLVGVSLHALQDFYSHSSWVDDPARRGRTWFELGVRERQSLDVRTGAFERVAAGDTMAHGTIGYSCALLDRLDAEGRERLRAACMPGSPLAGTAVCAAVRLCEGGGTAPVPRAWRDQVPGFLRPVVDWVMPGVNLDSRWLAEIGARQRAVPGLDGRAAFAAAYDLAAGTSLQWLDALASMMAAAGHGGLWAAAMTEATRPGGEPGPWESPDLLPYQFLSAGPYPSDETDAQRWYLRLAVTGTDGGSAASGCDLVPEVDGVRYAGPVTSGPVASGPHVPGSGTARIVGPLPHRPRTLSLRPARTALRRRPGGRVRGGSWRWPSAGARTPRSCGSTR